MAYQSLSCQPNPNDPTPESLQYLRCYIGVMVAARNALKRSNRRNILQASLLHVILVDLENTSDKLKRISTDRHVQPFGALIKILQAALARALDELEEAELWYGKYEALGTPIDETTMNVAKGFHKISMSCCQNCHDLLREALDHPDHIGCLASLELDKYNIFI